MSHSFARGSVIFEVISFHKTDRGSAVFRLDEHVNRLFGTADFLLMELPLSKQATEVAVLETVKMNQLEQGFIKLVCYYGEIVFEVSPPNRPLDMCIVAVDPLSSILKDWTFTRPKLSPYA
jgi:branched-chain amino acid aminotransferase